MNLRTIIRMLGIVLLLTGCTVAAETSAPRQQFDTITANLAAALATLDGTDTTQLHTDLRTVVGGARACAGSRRGR